MNKMILKSQTFKNSKRDIQVPTRMKMQKMLK